MNGEFWNQTPRMPRHATGDTQSVQVLLRRIGGKKEFQAQLLDLSRNGARLATTSPVPARDEVDLQISGGPNDLDLQLRATVRWCRGSESEGWQCGLLLSEPLDWEVLGELFLTNVLMHEPTSAG